MRLLFFIFFTNTIIAQVGTGQWRLHVASSRAIDVTAQNGSVYAAFENGLLEYDISSKETSVWTDVNGLSDINLTTLYAYGPKNALYIGYDNGNLDKIVDNRVTNIPAIKLAQIPGSKRINKIVPHNGYIYLATGFSIVKIDPSKDEVKDTWYPTNGNEALIDIAFRNDSIYALTNSKMYSALVSNFALADPNQWIIDTRLPTLFANSYKEIEVIDNELFVLFNKEAYGEDSVFRVNDTNLELVTTESNSLEIYSISTTNGKLVINADGAVYHYNLDLTQDVFYNSFSLGDWISPLNSFVYQNSVWAADARNGLLEFSTPFTLNKIHFEGPPKKEFYSLEWFGGKLAVAGGGLASVSSTFSGSGIYLLEDEKWSKRDRDNTTAWNGINIWDFLSVAINPTNKEQLAVGTFSSFPLSIMGSNGQVSTLFTPDNSTLQYTEVGGALSLVNALKYDEKGNLWVLNGYTNTPLNVYTKEGTWHAFQTGSASQNRFARKLEIDYNGNKWFTIDGGGVFAFNDNGTPSNPTDDKYKVINSGDLTGGLPSNGVNAIAVDFDNEIWIGTDNGFAVLYNSENVFDAAAGEYNAQRIKIEYQGNVEYVLGNTNITDIEVDGANRKWFATANAGLILLSADGLEVLEQFTAENSPLISNNISDIKLDQSTGELFIVTDKGLVSYRTDATYEDPEYSNVKVFPNPARPDYDGPITIQGIRYNSDVKITDVAGNLVYQTTSNGGTATWTGKTLTGENVTSGVYLIWTAANEGKGRKVGKVLIVR
jgi:ligand-binding sensor domain-containing protein